MKINNVLKELKTDKELVNKINILQAKVGVIGLGYVGLSLTISCVEAGFQVTGYDNNISKINQLIEGREYVSYIESGSINKYVQDKKLKLVTEVDDLKECDVIIISVPTPIDSNNQPDLSCLHSALSKLAPCLRKGQLIIVESTIYPTALSKIVTPLLKGNGFHIGKDIFLSYSPERIDPGNTQYKITDIPKLIGGATEQCSNCTEAFYSKFIKNVIIVDSPEIAEMAKLLENTYRLVNIALVNEVTKLCHHLDINVWDVIQASSTKPFGFQPFQPGPGVGGHCIPIDPYYMKWIAEENGLNMNLIDISAQINDHMPHFIVKRIEELKMGVTINNIVIVGISYKKDVNDLRNSTALSLINELERLKYNVEYLDNYFESLTLNNKVYTPIDPLELHKFDLVIIHSDHSNFDYQFIYQHSKLIFDTRNIMTRLGYLSPKVINL